MSATPESFLDTMDADVEVTNEGATDLAAAEPGIQRTDGAGQDAGKTAETKTVDPAQAKDKVDPAGGAAVEKVVPLRALQEEREQAKELKRQIAELQALPKLSAEDAELLKELKAQRAAVAAPKAVDFMEDPKGYVDAIDKKAQDALDKLKKANDSTTQQFTAQQQFQALQAAVTASEQAFVQEVPDYVDALAHVRSVRAQQIQLASPEATADQISNAIACEEMYAAESILKRGGNPCDFAYKYAKTLGYQKKAPAVDPKAGMAEAADKSAVRTLGAGGGDAPTDAALDDDDPNSEFKAAQAAFRRRR